MVPVEFEQATQYLGEPPDWDEKAHGPCDVLPVCPHSDGSNESRWRPSPKELQMLNEGAAVQVHVVGGQPAIKLGVV